MLSLFLTEKEKTSKFRLLTRTLTCLILTWKQSPFYRSWLENALNMLELKLLRISRSKNSLGISQYSNNWKNLSLWKLNVLRPLVTVKTRRLSVVTCRCVPNAPCALPLRRNLPPEWWPRTSLSTSREIPSVNWSTWDSYVLPKKQLWDLISSLSCTLKPGWISTQKTNRTMLSLKLCRLVLTLPPLSISKLLSTKLTRRPKLRDSVPFKRRKTQRPRLLARTDVMLFVNKLVSKTCKKLSSPESFKPTLARLWNSKLALLRSMMSLSLEWKASPSVFTWWEEWLENFWWLSPAWQSTLKLVLLMTLSNSRPQKLNPS